MNKILFIVLTVLSIQGCGSREDTFKELTDTASKSVKDACDKIGGKVISGIEVSYGTFQDEVTVGYYCIPPDKKLEIIR